MSRDLAPGALRLGPADVLVGWVEGVVVHYRYDSVWSIRTERGDRVRVAGGLVLDGLLRPLVSDLVRISVRDTSRLCRREWVVEILAEGRATGIPGYVGD